MFQKGLSCLFCVDINECVSTPCQNGGTCADGINGYTCTCANGWEGAQCQSGTYIGESYITVHMNCEIQNVLQLLSFKTLCSFD